MKGNPEAKMLLKWIKKNNLSTDKLCVNLSDRALEFDVYLPRASVLFILLWVVLDLCHLGAWNMKSKEKMLRDMQAFSEKGSC